MTHHRQKLPFLLLLLLLAGLSAARAAAQPASGARQGLALEAGSGRVLTLPGPASNVFVADPKVAEVRPASPRSTSAAALAGVAAARMPPAAARSGPASARGHADFRKSSTPRNASPDRPVLRNMSATASAWRCGSPSSAKRWCFAASITRFRWDHGGCRCLSHVNVVNVW